MKLLFVFFYFSSLLWSSLEIRPFYHCPTLRLPNGIVRLKQRGRSAKFSCSRGFMLSGDSRSYCIHNKWDSPVPICVRPGCRKVTPPNNVQIFPTHSNSVLHFFCKPGFEIRGPNITHCNGTMWSENLPTCLATNSTPEMSCDFEKPDICGWSHALNHDFEWARMQFNTPTGVIGTGPSFDHTYGEGKAGYYMYIESTARSPNDTARLISPIYDKTENDTCFKFSYHMYGGTVGSLRVYKTLINESWNLDPKKAFFEKHGNQGNRWIDFVHLFGPIPNDYQIIIEGVRGNGYLSDIAIDDVSIIENCNIDDLLEPEISTTTEQEDDSPTAKELLPDDTFSCVDNCFSITIMVGKHRTCSCDENCFERSDCCPDFFDVCLDQGSTLSTDSDYSTSTIPVPSTSNYHASTKQAPIAGNITEEEIIPTRRTTKIIQTEQPHTQNRYTQSAHTEAEISSYKTARQAISTTEKFTAKIFSSTISTTEEEAETLSNVVKDNLKEKSKKVSDVSNDIPEIPNDMVPIEDVAHLKRKFDEKIVQVISDKKNYTVWYLGWGVVLTMLLFTIFIVLFVRRKMITRLNRLLRSAAHGDSASDVRFLTSDELLDFNVDY